MRRLADALRACGLVKRLGALDGGRVERARVRVGAGQPRGARRLHAGVGRPGGRAARRGRAAARARRRLQHPARRDARAAPARPLRARCTSTGTWTSATRAGRAGSAPSRARTSRASPGAWSRSCRTSTASARTSLDADAVHLGDREGDPGELAAVARDRHHRLGGCDALRTRRRRSCPAVPYWVHVDADVIDSALLPAVDSPPRRADVRGALRAPARRVAGGAVGMQVTVFDPDLDPDGSQAQALTDCLVSALGRA